MSIRLLAAALLASSGCVVPTPLELAPSTQQSGGPKIIRGKPVDFDKPVYMPAGHNSEWIFGVTASDTGVIKPGDIHARLFYLNGNTQVGTGEDVVLVEETPGSQTYSGEFLSTARCEVMNASPGQTFLFFVYVSDEGFPTTGLKDLRANHFDFKSWVVTCP